MATVKCPLGKRSSPSHEWYDGEKSRIYCMGWEDKRTDAPLEACLNCPDHVSKAQDDLDKWRAEHGYTQKIPAQKRLIYAEDLCEPVDVNILVVSAGGRSGGKTMALYEALFRKRVELAPTIDAVPVVHARWEDFCRGKVCGCSACKAHFDNTCNDIRGEWHYCPNCGAKMDLEEV